ncbi:hypothetical protein ACJIZ3_019573 [Penstemon smallii]|uniref:Uncharacterized protein n=1 Tax=Penstemon smallii TaxID=265156 RepID=A0ABD3T2D4_9LAMI
MDPKTIKEILDEVSNTENLSTKISKLKDYANNLELEINNMKIAEFCFPITIVNLSDVLSTIREELARLRQGPRDSLFPTILGGGLVVPSRTGRGGGGGGVGLQISEANGSLVPTVFANVKKRGREIVPSGPRGGLQISESSGSEVL